MSFVERENENRKIDEIISAGHIWRVEGMSRNLSTPLFLPRVRESEIIALIASFYGVSHNSNASKTNFSTQVHYVIGKKTRLSELLQAHAGRRKRECVHVTEIEGSNGRCSNGKKTIDSPLLLQFSCEIHFQQHEVQSAAKSSRQSNLTGRRLLGFGEIHGASLTFVSRTDESEHCDVEASWLHHARDEYDYQEQADDLFG
jgi:hypothetical protein